MTNTIYLLVFLLSLALSSCGGGEHSATDTGSASFGLTFEEASAPAMKLAPSAAPADICSSYGIDSISGTVYNSSNSVIATGGPWACSAHQGTITNIPTGSNLRIAIQGTVSGSVVWQGETAGVTIYADQDTNVGSIPMTYIGSDTTAPTNTTSSNFINSGSSSTSSTSVTLAISATDAVGVTAYYASETSTAPSASASGWTAVTSTTSYSGSVSFTLSSGDGTKTVYVWFKDAAGSVSAAVSDSITLSIVVRRVPDTGQTTSYTDTFGEDSDYTINSPSYTDNGDGTVTDNITGLMWQKQGDGTARTWADAGAYCDASTLGGYSDWRLPSQIELISIIDNGVYNPSINTIFFPGTLSSTYWSSTTAAYSTEVAWFVYFSLGFSYFDVKTDSHYVRCVRGGETTQSLTDNGNGTVTDSGTLLTWQQGENSAMTWEAALSYCEGLSLADSTDWRLPNHKELLSLVDYTRYNPSINTTLFPNAISSYYWSSTAYSGGTSALWVNFWYYGDSNSGSTANSNYVRCVRGGE